MCPEGAISEEPNVIGVIERGPSQVGFPFVRGLMNIGEPMAVPIIRQLKQWADPDPDQVVIIDVSPGTSCPVVEAVRSADFLLLVTEPTPFGLHDLKLAHGAVQILGIPSGLVINRSDLGDDKVNAYAAQHDLPILMEIPFDRKIAEAYSRGKMIVDVFPEYWEKFRELLTACKSVMRKT